MLYVSRSQEQIMPTQDANPNPTSSFISVLIADDLPDVRQDLRMLLELAGHFKVVGEAANGLEAVQKAEEYHPDVVVLDLEMPVMDGIQAAFQIKDRHLARKVVILSIHADPDNLERARKAGADDYVQKGASIESLIQAIVG
jgi:DNA-binding NarL/FixJ family response regulator